MDAALSFDRVWVRIVHSRRESPGASHHQQQQCDCLDRLLPEGVPPPHSCNRCLFVAAEVGATETVADLKSMLLELLPSCFHTNYDLLLPPRPSHALEESQKRPLVLQDSCRFADLSLESGEVIDLIPRTWDPRSSLLHLRRMAEVLYEPKAIMMKQLPDTADPCGAFGSLLRPVVLQQLAAAAAQQDGDAVGCGDGRWVGDVQPSAAAPVCAASGRKRRSSRRKAKGDKSRPKAPGVASWGEGSEEREADAVDDCPLFFGWREEPLGSMKLLQQQLTLLQQSLLPCPLKPKEKLLSFLRVYPGGPPTPAARLAGHVLWVEAATLEGLRLFIAGTERGFCVSSIREEECSTATLPPCPREVFPLHCIAAPDGRSLPFSEAARELLFDTLAQLFSAYSKAFADGLPLLAPEPLDADLPLHAMRSLQPFLPPFATEMEEMQAKTSTPDSQLLDPDNSVVSARRLWDAEAAVFLGWPPASDFTQRIGSEKLASKVYAEFREAALVGAVALRERRLLPLDGCLSGRSTAAAEVAAEADLSASTAPRQVYVNNNILLVPDKEPLALSCCGGEPPIGNLQADVAAREALRKAAEAAEVARLCEDDAVTAAAAAAGAAAVASVAPPGSQPQHQPPSAIAVAVDFAGARILCQGIHEEALARYCIPEVDAAAAATGGSVESQRQPKPQQEDECENTLSAEVLGIKWISSKNSNLLGPRRLSPLDVMAAPFGLRETPAELAAAAASAAVRHSALPRGEAAVAAAVAAEAAAAAELSTAAAAAGLAKGPSHASPCPEVRPELLRAFLTFRKRQLAFEQQQQQQRPGSSSSTTGDTPEDNAVDDEPPTFDEELRLRTQGELRAHCSSSTKELLHAGSWFGADSKGGSNGCSRRLQRLQQLTLECCNDTVLRCMERAKEQQESLLVARRGDIQEVRAAIQRQVEQTNKERQPQQEPAHDRHDEKQRQEETAEEGPKPKEDRLDAAATQRSADGQGLAETTEIAAGARAGSESAGAAGRSSDVALLSLLGEDVSLLSDDCDLPARAASLAAEACALAFPPPPSVPASHCLLVDAGTEALPLDSPQITPLDRDNLLLLAAYLRQVAVPLAARLLSLYYPGGSPPLDSQGLKDFLHRYGLNCRHLGAVFRAVEATCPSNAASLPLMLLERDIILRCAKAHINRLLSTLTLGEVAPAAAHLISCLFAPFLPSMPTAEASAGLPDASEKLAIEGACLHAVLAETPQTFWSAVRLRAWTRFGQLLPHTPLSSRGLGSIEGRFVLLRSLCAALGLQLRSEVPARLLQQQQQQLPKWMLLLHGKRQQEHEQQHPQQELVGWKDSGDSTGTKDTASDSPAGSEQKQTTSAADEQDQQQQQAKSISNRGHWLVHAEDVVRVEPVLKGPQPPSHVSRALLAAASYCCSCGNVGAALDLLQQALCVAHQLSGAVCSEAATCYAAIGQLLGLLDDPLNACNNVQKSLILSERCTGPDHPFTLDIHCALAHAFSRLPGDVYKLRSLRHMQRALLLLHTWAGGLCHPMLPLMLLGASRCVLQQLQHHELQKHPNPHERQQGLDSAIRLARAAEAALEDMQDISPAYGAEVYSELSWTYESLRDWRKALDWARAARGEYVKANVDPKTKQEAEARMLWLTKNVVMHAQQQKIHQQQREMLVSRLRHAAELKRINNRAGTTALLACAGS